MFRNDFGKMQLRLVPEFAPVSSICMCFVHDFYNTRFNYGSVLAEIAASSMNHTSVEFFIADKDFSRLEGELDRVGLTVTDVKITVCDPPRGIINETTPLFATSDSGEQIAVVYRCKNDDTEFCFGNQKFSRWMAGHFGLKQIDLDITLGSAAVAINNDVVLVSKDILGHDAAGEVGVLASLFSHQQIFTVDSLPEEVTNDLDTYILPVTDKTWFVSDYSKGTPQFSVVEEVKNLLKDLGHAVVDIPTLPPIRYDDVNTMPNYANSVILNGCILAPKYYRPEDDIFVGICKDFFSEIRQIDCRDLVLMNSVLHCISKTIPHGSAVLPLRQ